MANFNFTEKTTPENTDFIVGYDGTLGAVSGAERKFLSGNMPFVNLTGDQTVAGNKTFSSNVVGVGSKASSSAGFGVYNSSGVSCATFGAGGGQNATIPASLMVSDLTADRVVVSSSTKVLQSSAVTATELVYVSGVTSSIQTQFGEKAPLASPALTGTPTAPTATQGNNSTQLATTAYVDTGLVGKLGNQSVFRDCDVLCPTSSSVFSGLKFWQVSEVFKTFDNGAIDSKFTSYDSGDGWRFKVSDGNGIIYSLNIDGNHNKYSTGNLRVGTLNVALTSAGVIIGGDNFTGEIGSVGSGTSVIHRSKLYLKNPSDSTNTYVFRCGLISQVSKEQPICGVWLEYDKDINSGNWVLYSKNGGSVSSTNTSVAPRFHNSFDCDYYQEIEVFLTSSAAVARFRDFGNSGPGAWSSDFSVTTNLPLTGGYGTGHGCGGAVIASTASTATKDFYIDYLFYRRVQE